MLYLTSTNRIWDLSVVDVWKSNKRKGFLKMQLMKRRYDHPVCKLCRLPCYFSSPEDIVDA